MPSAFRPLAGCRIVSLALNIPGPVALAECRALGARCRKVEPPAGDPLQAVAPPVYDDLHQGVTLRRLDLKSVHGRRALDRSLASADVLLTAFRPQALTKLGLGWPALQARHPGLWHVAIQGSAQPGRGDEAGHDLTYQAEQGLLVPGHLPSTLVADMAGAQTVVSAVLQAALGRRRGDAARRLVVGLGDAAERMAAPRRWGLTAPGGVLGGAHAGYQVLAARDGWVALAALEPHFGERLAVLANLGDRPRWRHPATRSAVAAWVAAHDTQTLAELAREHDLPLVVCPLGEAPPAA
jgi:crotonobetainyl-CoA:carnitine CoA-transferase CaiB-like acyl-CoA transferase